MTIPVAGKALVVDDVKANRDLLALRLEQEGLAVTQAASGEEALAILERDSFDLICLDVMMPGLDGAQVLEHIKRSPRLREVPVLMISATDELETVVHCLELGAEDYLGKPFRPAILRARVRSCLMKKRFRDEEQKLHLALAAEHERAEHLLLNVLPRNIAERLKQTEATIAESYPEVTILFADIVGFTRLAARTPPQELVALLNEIFSGFDALVDRHGLEKIKTIGDAYLVAAGVPLPRRDHAAAIAEMALDMRESLRNFNARSGRTFEMRIGINTGPVVAGVIGLRKFIFDLWGDAVNTASRMESHGEPGRIQVSETTFALLRERYEFEERGAIEIKGKGIMRTWFLRSRAPAASTSAHAS